MSSSLIVCALPTGMNLNDSLTRFHVISGNLRTNATELETQIPVRDAGDFGNFFVYAASNTISVNSTSITLRKSGADAAVQVLYGSDETGIKEDTTNTETFAATDEVGYSTITPSEAGTNTISLRIMAIQFDPATSGNTISFANASVLSAAISTDNATVYEPIGGDLNVSTVPSEDKIKQRIRASFTASNLYTYAESNNSTTTNTFKTRKNAADGNQSVAYTSGETGVKEDTSNTDSISAGDDFNHVLETGATTDAFTINVVSVRMLNTAGKFVLFAADTADLAVAANSTIFAGLACELGQANATETNSQIYPRFTFTASELVSYVNSNSGASLVTNITLRDNGGDSSVTVQYIAGETGLKNDTTNTAEITSGADEVDYEVTCLDLTGGVSVTWIGIIGGTAQPEPAPAAVVSSQRMKTRMMLGVGL